MIRFARLRPALLTAALLALAAPGLSGDALGRSASDTVTVAVSGNGRVTGPRGLNCTNSGGASCVIRVDSNENVSLTEIPDAGATFNSWGGDPDCSTETTCTFTTGGDDYDVLALFNGGGGGSTFPLTVAVTGNGKVTGGGISCGAGATTCSAGETSGASVILTATPSAGATFTGWSGACAGTATTCTVAMNAAKSVQATFSGASGFALTVTVAGNGKVTGGGISCGVGGSTCTQNEASGSSVTLTAATVGGSTFTGWSGACTGTALTCIVSMTAAKSATATFTGGQVFALTVSVTGSGSVTGGGISCGNGASACKVDEAGGATVVLTATPALGASFKGWSGTCTGATLTCTVAMTAAKSVSATFAAGVGPPSGKATLTLTVAGRGTVTTSGGSCTSGGATASCTQTFPTGTAVSVTASPGPGASFAGWSGACTGKAACSVTLTSSKSVTAVFGGSSGGAAFNLKSLGAPIVSRLGHLFLVTVRFGTSRPGTAQLRLFRDGHTATWVSFPAHAGGVRFGPFIVSKAGRYSLVLVLTDLSGQTRTLRWTTCLGPCPKKQAKPPKAPNAPALGLERGTALVVPKATGASVTLRFTTNEPVSATVQVYRNGKAALVKPLHFSFPKGPVAVGPFGVNQPGNYRFVLIATDKQGRQGTLAWVVMVKA